jgi:MarR family transcriptional regulator, 2-MHQ and catechol-resistance regulon repressor
MDRSVSDPMPHPPPGGVLGTSLKLWIVLARAYESVAKHAADDVARHGLTIPEFGIIEVLYHKGPLLLREVQKRVLVSSGGTTFLVDRLVAKGLVERRDCATDRRARYAALTPAGEALIARIFPEHAARIARAVSGLSATEQRALTEALKVLGMGATAQMAAESVASDAPAARRRRTKAVARG